MWPWRVKMPTQNLLRLLLLLRLVMKIMLATVCCRFGSWGLVIKLNFCSNFEHKVWSRFWSWSLVSILLLVEVTKLILGQDSEARFGQNFEAYVLWKVWCLVEILKLVLGRDSEDELLSRFVFELVTWTQPLGPLCLPLAMFYPYLKIFLANKYC